MYSSTPTWTRADKNKNTKPAEKRRMKTNSENEKTINKLTTQPKPNASMYHADVRKNQLDMYELDLDPFAQCHIGTMLAKKKRADATKD